MSVRSAGATLGAGGRKTDMITVFLVDDHEVVRRGLADLLEEEADFSVIGQASSVAEAMARIPALQPDIAVLDIRLPDGNGVELCRELRSKLPNLNCLMLTSFTDEHAMLDAIMAGQAVTSSRTSRGWSSSPRSGPSGPDARCWTTGPLLRDEQVACGGGQSVAVGGTHRTGTHPVGADRGGD